MQIPLLLKRKWSRPNRRSSPHIVRQSPFNQESLENQKIPSSSERLVVELVGLVEWVELEISLKTMTLIRNEIEDHQSTPGIKGEQ